jgi:Dehydrogenases with different specificities (related to short-chain alcohol dehydrogenases)
MDDYLKIFSLKGKKAVITGGAGALCSAIAMGLGKAGAEIAICDICDTSKVILELKKEGITARGYHIDVLDLNEIELCKDKILKDFSTVDILVNGAGGNLKEATVSSDQSFFDLKKSSFEKIINLNLLGGTIFPSQVFGKIMVKNQNGGSIINISSMNAFRPLTKIAGYSAAKAAVSNFTQWLAVHFALEYNKKLRVNAIAPGFFLTEQLKYLYFNEDGSMTERAKRVLSHTPMGDYGKKEDLIGACIWLASDASNFVTGTIIPIDGGFSAYSGV